MTAQARTRRNFASVMWRDLVPMRRIDGLIECLHPLPWLAGSWIAFAAGWWPVAAAASFMFFLTALRLNHEAIHGNLGFGPQGHRLVLHGLSALMLGSNNAVAHNHLRHHAKAGTEEDIEGGCGRMTWFRVLITGPLFPLHMHLAAWRSGGRALHRRMMIDGALNLTVITATVASDSPILLYHMAAMSMAQCLTAFFAVWITHHDIADGEIARTQRSILLNWASYNMLLHLEHHVFPAVPVRRLGILARRMDAVRPLDTTVRLVLPEPGRPALSIPAATR